MCDLKEAQRQEKMARMFEDEGNKEKAIEHYVEAASIYVLNAQLLTQDILIRNANECYGRVQLLRGDKEIKEFSKQELARRTLLDGKRHHHERDDLEKIGHLLH